MQVMEVWCSAWPCGSRWSMDHGGSLPAPPSCGDFSLWVQFRRSERDFPVRSQAPGWVQMAKTQRWELGWRWSWDGAGMGMEPLWGPWAPARPAQPGTRVGTEGDSDPPTPQSHCRDRPRGHR